MRPSPQAFAVNTYSYIMSHGARECLDHLAQQGYTDFELMLFPGHLWPPELDAGARRALRGHIGSHELRVTTLNMPNIDFNIAAATREMREYSLGILREAVVMAGDLGVPGVLIGPGKQNPLFSLPQTRMMDYFFAALDALVPLAERCGTTMLIENLPFAFLPDAQSLMSALARYGNPRVGIVYDVANAVFHGEDPVDGLRQVRERLRLVHLSDTRRDVYRHDPVGYGIVPFARLPAALDEIGHREAPMLEIITNRPDQDIRDSAQKLSALDWPSFNRR